MAFSVSKRAVARKLHYGLYPALQLEIDKNDDGEEKHAPRDYQEVMLLANKRRMLRVHAEDRAHEHRRKGDE